jgi:hypothetical protein
MSDNPSEWFPAFAVVLLIIGLPIVLATAFVQEGGPRRGAEVVEVAGPDSPSGGTSGLFTWRNAILGGVATPHQRGTADLLGDDPRYQALLEEAGITW